MTKKKTGPRERKPPTAKQKDARFKPGNPHRFQPGQSGNPLGRPRGEGPLRKALMRKPAELLTDEQCEQSKLPPGTT